MDILQLTITIAFVILAVMALRIIFLIRKIRAKKKAERLYQDILEAELFRTTYNTKLDLKNKINKETIRHEGKDAQNANLKG